MPDAQRCALKPMSYIVCVSVTLLLLRKQNTIHAIVVVSVEQNDIAKFIYKCHTRRRINSFHYSMIASRLLAPALSWDSVYRD